MNFKNTQEAYNGTRNLTQQDFQTPSHFVIEEIVETISSTTQQSISPIHPTQTTSYSKSIPFPKTTIQSTVKPSFVPKYSQMDYQTFRSIDKSRQSNKQRYQNRNNLANHTYNFSQTI